MYANNIQSSNLVCLSSTYHLYGCVVYLNMIHQMSTMPQQYISHIWMYDFSPSQTNNLKLKMSKQVLNNYVFKHTSVFQLLENLKY